jgi:hypothetical protein
MRVGQPSGRRGEAGVEHKDCFEEPRQTIVCCPNVDTGVDRFDQALSRMRDQRPKRVSEISTAHMEVGHWMRVKPRLLLIHQLDKLVEKGIDAHRQIPGLQKRDFQRELETFLR